MWNRRTTNNKYHPGCVHVGFPVKIHIAPADQATLRTFMGFPFNQTPVVCSGPGLLAYVELRGVRQAGIDMVFDRFYDISYLTWV